jgi:hypothetical protein
VGIITKIELFCSWFSTVDPDSHVLPHHTALLTVRAARGLNHSNVQRVQMPATPPRYQCFNTLAAPPLFYVHNFARPECPALFLN